MSIKTHGRMVTDGSISSDNLADDAVTSAKIANNAVGTTEVADNSITGAKLGISGAQSGEIMYYDGTDWVRSTTNLTFPGGKAPYDVSFIAGFDSDNVAENLSVKRYGQMVMSRSGDIEAAVGHIDNASSGADVIVDIEKNGGSIYSTKPKFTAGANTITAGVLSTTTFSSGDRITFRVTQIGSGNTGQGLRFMFNCKV